MLNIILIATVFSGFLFTIQAQDRCLVCESNQDDTSCIDTPIVDKFLEDCPAQSNSSCFTRVHNGNVVRGCLNMLKAEDVADCDSETCKICKGSECNKGLFPANRIYCHQCGHQNFSKNVSKNVSKNSSCTGVLDIEPTLCALYGPGYEKCYIYRPEGTYERGCASNLIYNPCDKYKCFFCESNGCNYIDYNSANRHSIKSILFAILSLIILCFL